MSPFDKAYTTCYSPFIEIMSINLVPFSRYRELLVEICSFFSIPHVLGALVAVIR